MTQQHPQPYPLAVDYDPLITHVPPVPHEEPQPAWFTRWHATEFAPFKASVTRKLAVKDLALAAGKYLGVGIVGAVVAKFPQLAEHAPKIIDFLTAVLGAG